MTSALYNRYIPPPQAVSLTVREVSVAPTSSGKKRKRHERQDIVPNAGVGAHKSHQHHSDGAVKGTIQADGTTIPADALTNERASETPYDSESAQRSRKLKVKRGRHREEESDASSTNEGKNSPSNQNPEPQIEVADADSSTGRQNVRSEGNEASENDMHGDSVIGTKHKSIRSKFQRSQTLASATITDADAEPSAEGNLAETEVELHDLVPLPQPDPVQQPQSRSLFSALPPWLVNPIRVSTLDSRPLEDLKLTSKVLSVLQKKGYQSTFAVQTAVIPLLLPGPEQHAGDICISAATGSGKTLAYILPLIESLRKRTVLKLRAVIVVPTRELVMQAWEVCELCATGSGLKVGTAVGNKSLKEEKDILVKKTQRFKRDHCGEWQEEVVTGGVGSFDSDTDPYNLEDVMKTLPGHFVDYESNIDVLICTPGRLVDHMRRTKGFSLDHVQWLVIDEADRLLNESFQEWVETVMKALEGKRTPEQNNVRQMLLSKMGVPQEHRSIRKVILSATMTKDVGRLNALKLLRPKLVVVETTTSEGADDVASRLDLSGGENQVEGNSDGYDLPPTLHEKAVAVGDGSDKPLYLLELLKTQLDMSQPPERGFRTPGSGVTSGAADVDLDSAIQGPAGVPTLHDVDERSTSFSSSEDSDTSCESSPHVDQASRHEEPTYPTQGVLIFANNNENALRLARLLSILHPPYSTAIGTLTKSTSTSAGRQVLSAFRTGKVPILIASDRASRGLDVPNLRCVINYDIPTSVTSYVHRVGRTARAGKEGFAWTLTAHHEARWFWNEIARGRQIRRGPDKKVARARIDVECLGEQAKIEYVEALKMLGEEATGKVNHR